MNFRQTLLLLALAGGLVPGCQSHEQPDDAFRGFLAAVVAHQEDLAWDHLSKASQAAMKAARDEAAAASPKGSVPDDPRDLLFGEDVNLARPVDEVKVASEHGNDATLEVSAGGQKHEVHMVREDGLWKLDLTAGLKL